MDRDSGDRNAQSRELLVRVAERDSVLTVQVLAEFFHVTTRKRLLRPSLASAFVRDWLNVFHIAFAAGAALEEAMEAVEEHRLSFWDAMVWATARRSGCSALVTEDMQHGRRLGGIEIINSFATDGSARLATLLGA